MRLTSVRDLKAELLHEMEEPIHVKVARRHLVEMGMVGGTAAAFPRPSLALGVARGSGAGPSRFTLAIRLFDQTPLTHHMALLALNRSRGEAQSLYVGPVRAPGNASVRSSYRRTMRPIAPGYSVAHYRVSAGTIGGFVTRSADNYIYILSNNHVLANTNRGKRGDDILQPGRFDGGQRGHHLVGWLHGARRLVPEGNEIDAAVALLSADVGGCDPLYDGHRLSGAPREVDLGDRVWKVGRTTGVTSGRVTAFGLDRVDVDYSDQGDGSAICSFDDQIEIMGTPNLFSRPGDSGSLVIGDDLRAVGLLFAGSDEGVTYANPIKKVLDAFGAKLEM